MVARSATRAIPIHKKSELKNSPTSKIIVSIVVFIVFFLFFLLVDKLLQRACPPEELLSKQPEYCWDLQVLGEMPSPTIFHDAPALLTQGAQHDAGEPVARRFRPAPSSRHRRVRKPASCPA